MKFALPAAVDDDGGMSDSPQSPFDDQTGNFSPPGTPPPPPPPPGAPAGPSGFQPPPPPGYVPYADHQAGVGGLQLASPGKRILARIIDGLIFAAIFFVLALAFGADFVVGGVGRSDVFAFQLLVLLISIGYEAAFLVARGATPGKMVMSVKVVFEDSRTLDLQGALMRLSINIVLGVMALVAALATLTSLINIVVLIVSLVFLFTHERRQTVWDRIAKTVVIDA